MKPDLNNIFSSSSCLSLQDMKDYISGNLNDSDRRRIEMHIADCQMCNDELEGFSNLKDAGKLDGIITSINDEIEKTKNENFVSQAKKFNLKRVLSFAAAVALLITAGYIVNNLYNPDDTNLADMQVPEEVTFLEKEATKVLTEDTLSFGEKRDLDDILEESGTDKSIVEQEERIVKDIVEITEINKDIANEDDFEFDADVSEPMEISVRNEETGTSDNKKEVVSEEINEEKVVSLKTDIADEAPAVTSGDKKKGINIGATRGNNNRKKSISVSNVKLRGVKSSAELSYDEKVYGEAIEGFDEYLEYKPNDFGIIYKKGKSLYFIKKYSEAVSEFDKIIISPSSILKEDAEWYKIMCLIKQGKKSDAETLLKKIVSTKGKYKDKASDVLKQLNNQ